MPSNIERYNDLRKAITWSHGYSHKQTHGLKLIDLEDLFFFNCARVKYKITGKKRHWIMWKLNVAL